MNTIKIIGFQYKELYEELGAHVPNIYDYKFSDSLPANSQNCERLYMSNIPNHEIDIIEGEINVSHKYIKNTYLKMQKLGLFDDQ